MKNKKLIIGGVAVLFLLTTAFVVIKKKKPTPTPPIDDKDKKPEKKKAQIFIGDTISAGIGKPNVEWKTPSILGLGETIKSWFGNISNKPITFQTEGLAPITPTEVKTTDFKSELSKSLHQGYQPK